MFPSKACRGIHRFKAVALLHGRLPATTMLPYRGARRRVEATGNTRTHGRQGGRLRTEDGLPVCVKARLAYYASSKNARSILGQARSTIDLRQTILEGRVLLVSTAQGSAGRDVVALVGESLLNLVDW